MHATVRRIKVAPGRAKDVGRLIETGYLPLVSGLEGFVSYTLVDLGDDEVTSVGVFSDAATAVRANALAKEWTQQALAGLVAAPLEAHDGAVLVASAG